MAEKTSVKTCPKLVKPLADRVVVRPLDEADQMRGGLYIPDTAKEKPSQGEVIALGPGKLSEEGTRLDMDVSVGDKVLYAKYSGTDVTLDGEEYLILRESDILAIVP
jgi:chaperonin GroES